MPKNERLTAKAAFKLLAEHGFVFSRQSSSPAQYFKNDIRVTIPIHGDKVLHPKIIKQVLIAIELL